MTYEAESKKTILITEDIFKMLPVVRTVSFSCYYNHNVYILG